MEENGQPPEKLKRGIAKAVVYDQVKEFHKEINKFIMEHRFEYCPIAVVSALTMLTYDTTNALTQDETGKVNEICHDLYPQLRLIIKTGSMDDEKVQ